jgi:hypothetical protein
MLDSIILALSGLVIWKSVQFPLLRTLLGGYDNARVIHFRDVRADGVCRYSSADGAAGPENVTGDAPRTIRKIQ